MNRLVLILAVAAAGALPAVALATSTAGPPPFTVKPSTVEAGHVVKVKGEPNVCGEGVTVTIYSRAFPSGEEFAGVPAVHVKSRKNGRYTKHVRIPRSKDPGKYGVGVRCGGGNVGSRTIRVVSP